MGDLNQIFQALDVMDQTYQDSWRIETESWDRKGVYEKVAQMIDVPDGVHVDLGTGVARVLVYLRQRFDKKILFGVDRNFHAIRDAGRYMHSVGVVANILSNQRNNAISANQLATDFNAIDFTSHVPANCLIPGTLNLVCDDARQLGLLRQLLRDRRLSSGSMIFPGASTRPILEAPFCLDGFSNDPESRKQQISERQTQFIKSTREGAYRFMSREMVVGGEFVLAERIGIVDPRMTVDAIIRDVARQVGQYAQYWDIGDGVVLQDCLVNGDGSVFDKGKDLGERVEYSHLGGSQILSVAQKLSSESVAAVTVTIIKLIRNEVPFDEAYI